MDTRKVDERCTTDLVSLKNQFLEKGLQFKPDFCHPDYKESIDRRYCEIDGLPKPTEYDDRLKQINQNQWRTSDSSGQVNQRYEEDKLTLETFLLESGDSVAARDGGYLMFSKTIQKLWRGPATSYSKLPALYNYYVAQRNTRGYKFVVDQFANLVRVALKAETVLPTNVCTFNEVVKSATLSHEQCAALVARLFFDGQIKIDAVNFREILESGSSLAVEKLKFLFAYFDRIVADCPQGCVSFRLVQLDGFTSLWRTRRQTTPTDVRIYSDMAIEETALCTQVDFANKNLGGGVLREGAVQEQIRFLMCPEMIVGMLFATEEMSDYQAISIVGAHVYSSYDGYGRSLRWKELERHHARQNEASHRDDYGRLRVETVAIDAFCFAAKEPLVSQFRSFQIEREILKATVGFGAQGVEFDKIPIVTGFWGCGAFNGHKTLKFLQQVLAAGIANRPLVFCTFGDDGMTKQCNGIMAKIRKNGWKLGDIDRLLRAALELARRPEYTKRQTSPDFLYSFCMNYNNDKSEVDEEVSPCSSSDESDF